MDLYKRGFAALYDALNWGVEGRLEEYRRETAGRAEGDVLEIGGGTGANLKYYPAQSNLTVVEPNPHMVKRLRRRAEEFGREVAIVPDRGERLPFQDASFDSVVTTLVLCSVGDLDGVIREARRVLRQGGRFYFYEHVVASGPWKRLWQRSFRVPWRLLVNGCHLDRDIEGAVRRAGFSEISIRTFDLSVGVLVTLPNIVGVATV